MSVRVLAPPIMEFGFWFDGVPDGEALVAVARSLVDLGGSWGAQSFVHSVADSRLAFAGITDFLVASQSVDGPLGAEQVEGQRLVKVEMFEPGGGDAVVTFGRTATPVLQGHTVQLWLSGEEVQRSIATKKPVFEGARIGDLFRKLVGVLDPSYAAISFEWPLATPDGFADPVSGYDFRDFYFSAKFGGPDAIDRISAACVGGVERLSRGVLVLTLPALGGAKVDLAPTSGAVLRREVLIASSDARYR